MLHTANTKRSPKRRDDVSVSSAKKTFQRVPAAQWVNPNVNIHSLWTAAGTLEPTMLTFNIHELLGYCTLLRNLGEIVNKLDANRFHDGCLFFLRGGYGLWAYLNTESTISYRTTVFGGLNPGRLPKQALRHWLINLLTAANGAKRTTIDLLIIDEVNSGTGIGTQMNVIDATLNAWTGSPVSLSIDYVAVGHEKKVRADQLAARLKKWSAPRTYPSSTLKVDFEQILGTLLTYDDDELLGIARRANGYRVIKHGGAALYSGCPTRCHEDCVFLLGSAAPQTETLGAVARTIASGQTTQKTRQLDELISRSGCPQCVRMWCSLRPVGLSPAPVPWTDRLKQVCRRLCRWWRT